MRRSFYIKPKKISEGIPEETIGRLLELHQEKYFLESVKKTYKIKIRILISMY